MKSGRKTSKTGDTEIDLFTVMEDDVFQEESNREQNHNVVNTDNYMSLLHVSNDEKKRTKSPSLSKRFTRKLIFPTQNTENEVCNRQPRSRGSQEDIF